MRGKKIRFALKLMAMWCMAVMLIVMRTCVRTGESLSLFLVDLKNKFMDDPMLPQYFGNKLIFVTCFAMVCLAAGLCTDAFQWDVGIFGRRFRLTERTKLFPVAYNLVLLFLTAGFVVQLQSYVRPEIQSVFSDSWAGDTLIAHAGGGIDEENYTNSLDAFEFSYSEGSRTIELDFARTADDRLVCWHDTESVASLTAEAFLGKKIRGKYTPLSLEDVLLLMKKYDDVYVVTDTKNDSWPEIIKDFQIIVETAKELDCTEVLDRMVVQLYNHDMYDAVEEVHSFPNYILTLYKIGGNEGTAFIDHCRFCRNRGIDTITMWESWASPENIEIAKRYNIDIYVHTVNTVDQIEEDQALGVRGFYTDFVLPKMLVP